MAKAKSKPSPNRSIGKLISSADRPCFVLTARRQILLANKALANLLQVSVADLQKMDCSRTLTRDDSPVRAAAAFLSAATLSHQQGVSVVDVTLPNETLADSRSYCCVNSSLSDDSAGAILCTLVPAEQIATSSGSAHATSRSDQEPSLSEMDSILLAIRQRYDSLDGLTSLIGSSPANRRSLEQATAAIATESSVLIQASPGLQAAEIAKAVFRGRMRRQGIAEHNSQLLVIDCGLMDTGLLTNMLEIATDANESSIQRGVLFVDLHLLPSETWVLLRDFLRRIDITQLMATVDENIDKGAAGTTKKVGAEPSAIWREIMTLVGVIKIDLVDLKDRADDIPLLSTVLMRELVELSDSDPKKRMRMRPISREALDAMKSYAWPKNIDELRSILTTNLRAGHSDPIRVAELPVTVQSFGSFVTAQQNRLQPIELDSVLADVERSLIIAAMQQAEGNKAEAARLLAIQRSRLLRKLTQHAIDATEFAKAKPTRLPLPEQVPAEPPMPDRTGDPDDRTLAIEPTAADLSVDEPDDDSTEIDFQEVD
jgi:DNA-binding NtrC family response regulator